MEYARNNMRKYRIIGFLGCIMGGAAFTFCPAHVFSSSAYITMTPESPILLAASGIDARIQALENAFQAGILTKEEYAIKKEAIAGQSRQQEQEKHQKLKALEDALNAGIITNEEYRQKKSVISGGTPHPDTFEQNPAASARPPAEQPSAISGLEVIRDPAWTFVLHVPSGWKYNKSGESVLLGHDTIGGMILVLPHMDNNIQTIQGNMQAGLQDEGIALYPSDMPQTLEPNVVAAKYAGFFQGQQAEAYGIGFLSPHGGGAYIIAVTSPEKADPRLWDAAKEMVRTLEYVKADMSDLMHHFAGTWMSYSQYGQKAAVLGADGSFSRRDESSYGGNFQNQYGDQTGAWGAYNENQGRGRWTVRGSKERGVLLITNEDGSQDQVEYQVHVEKGRTYWSEYYFDGVLYGKQ